MNIRSTVIRASIALLLCNALLLSVAPRETRADVKDKVQIHIGRPSIWSLAQAHYLLASMHKKNLDLKTTMPTEADLDPNRANATQVQILKTLLDVEAQFNQRIGVQNSASLREQQFALKRRDQAQVELAARENELEILDARINKLKKELAPLEAEETQRGFERRGKDGTANTGDDEPLTDQDKQREKDIALLKEKISIKTAERTSLAAEIANLEKTATGPIPPPALTDPELTNANPPIQLPGLDNVQALIAKAIQGSGKPSIAASIALDNYVQMQYEIISKQLTLLRDELGPEERIVFLELPASIYTVPGRADDYIAQVQWKVTRYYSGKRDDEKDKQGDQTTDKKDDPKKDQKDVAKTDKKDDVKKEQKNEVTQKSAITQRDLNEQPSLSSDEMLAANNRGRWKDLVVKDQQSAAAINNNPKGVPVPVEWKDRYKVRALDIIPRQSALNINEYHATASRVNFLGVMKLLIGLGVRVNYQRQRELYEEFLQQEIYASGFGKGSSSFGWTYGPLPGNRRVAPGVRTTYAVLAVPRDASMLELSATGVSFNRKKAPRYDLSLKEFTDPDQLVSRDLFYIQIPNQETQNFAIESVEYTTVTKGQPVTAIIKGDYFSPQAGVLVNGVPLARALSATNTGSSAALPIGDSIKGVHGVYEQVSSREIVLNFSMGDSNYIGTPTITLVTPERSSAINFFPIWVNYHREHKRSLDEMSVTEPMFVDGFKLASFEIIEKDIDKGANDGGHVLARLTGTGMRRRATILINDQELSFRTPIVKKVKIMATDRDGNPGVDVWEYREIPSRKAVDCYRANGIKDPAYCPAEDHNFSFQESTNSYLLYFQKPKKDKWVIRYRHRTKQSIEQQETAYEVPNPSPFKVLHYLPDRQNKVAVVEVRYTTELKEPLPVLTINQLEGDSICSTGASCPAIDEGKGKFRQAFRVKYKDVGGVDVERDGISIKVVQGTGKDNTDTHEVSLPVTPSVTRINNPRLGRPVGYAGEQPLVTLFGFNLQQVSKVFFGDSEGKIAGAPSPTSILVRAPKLEGVPRGEAIQVPVTLEKLDGKKVSSVAFYTYIGSPVPIVVYHPRNRSERRSGNEDYPPEASEPDAQPEDLNNARPKPQKVKPGKVRS